MTADEFRQRRLALGLGQARLALLIGVACHTVGNWEQGRSPVPAFAVERLEEIERTRWPKRP